MAKVKVTTNFKINSLLSKPMMRDSDLRIMGQAIEDIAKEQIAAGISPVRGERRFERYKNTDRYPGGLKPNRPVNLNLSGEMLKHLTYRLKTSDTIDFGIIRAPHDVVVRARVHNDGERDDIAQRPFIPDKPGQSFSVSIMRKIREIYSKRLAAIIDESNK